jgi:hypothetical protein
MEQKRRFIRLSTNLRAEYSLKGSESEGKNCTVINISLNGAGLEFYSSERFDVGAALVLKIFDSEGKEAVGAEGVIKWSKQGEKDFVCGVELTDVLDKFTLSVLGV